jgi:hypothetical protein
VVLAVREQHRHVLRFFQLTPRAKSANRVSIGVDISNLFGGDAVAAGNRVRSRVSAKRNPKQGEPLEVREVVPPI